jgi:hypothetical protein
VPNGTYRIELSILKALGDPRNPAHFERWSSPDITIVVGRRSRGTPPPLEHAHAQTSCPPFALSMGQVPQPIQGHT